jgi:hypothetical protein
LRIDDERDPLEALDMLSLGHETFTGMQLHTHGGTVIEISWLNASGVSRKRRGHRRNIIWLTLSSEGFSSFVKEGL